MGCRGTIEIWNNAAAPTSDEKPVVLYTHWHAKRMMYDLITTLEKKERWNDAAYLSRMIFCEMVKDNLNNQRVIKDGVLLWMLNMSGLLFSGMDRFIIPSISDKGMLGTYYALSFIYLTCFTMIGSAVGYVIYPYLAQKKDVAWKQIILYTSILLIVIVAILRIWGNLLNHYAFSGKYDFVVIDNIAVPLLIMGILQCLNTIIHFYIYARASSNLLKKYVIFLFASCFLYYLSFSLFDSFIIYSLSNIIIQILILWLIKVTISFIVLFRITSININLKPA